jgi:N-acetylglutamate synthase-like GNAT family acetyltransferase
MTRVRRALPGDAEQIERLYAQLVNNPEIAVKAERIAEVSTDGRTALFVAELSGQVGGTAMVSLCADVMFGSQPFAVVENVVVDAKARNNGIGKELMHEVERLCISLDCSKIMLLSAATRSDAHRFFESLGFAASSKKGFVKYRRDFAPAR